jgi:hypothetical protein
MLCLAKRDIAPWGAVICLVTEAFFLQKNFLIFVEAPKRGRFLYSLHKFLGAERSNFGRQVYLQIPKDSV